MIKVLKLTQIDELRSNVDKSIIQHIRTGRVERFACFSTFDMISFNWYDINKEDSEVKPVLIYFSSKDLCILSDCKEVQKVAKSVSENSDDGQRILYQFFVELIKNDMDYLEKLEEEITLSEDDLLTRTSSECTEKIVEYRKRLLKLKRYYEQLNTIFEGFNENENNLLNDDYLRIYKILDNRVDRLFDTVLNLRDYVTQMREAYQARIDIEQNNLMRVFTVVTSIFLPLSLIAGWYGMNLRMPEFAWKYGYPMVIILSIAVCITCLIIFKKKKWF